MAADRTNNSHQPQTLAQLTAVDLVGPVSATIRDDATLWEALERFLLHHTRHLAVVDSYGRHRGVLSDGNLLLDESLDVPSLRHRRVSDVNWLDRPTVGPDTGITRIAELLTLYECDALPVIDHHGQMLGVVTRADVVRALADHGPLAPIEQRC
ncbi:CBS domain-containing protein [Streptomyces silvisoli]|uniref:CBS domain-containing protein n=1 Tax=Streptomyces silvisoli TaxID=3034235 RepID=A0ABT5ZS38_9ACTN|nr:CBS domain-containing protein [Streptomyces silvisoli]MDF3292640.1 CBS domain-containing protein [Streptomyces silvisoli]